MAYQLFFDLSLPIVPGQYAQNFERFELSPLGVAFPIKEGGIQRTEVKFGKVEVTLFEAQKINECNRLITTVEARLSISDHDIRKRKLVIDRRLQGEEEWSQWNQQRLPALNGFERTTHITASVLT